MPSGTLVQAIPPEDNSPDADDESRAINTLFLDLVGVGVGVTEAVILGVTVAVLVGVTVTVAVTVGVAVKVGVIEGVNDIVGVIDGVTVGVGVGVRVGLGVLGILGVMLEPLLRTTNSNKSSNLALYKFSKFAILGSVSLEVSRTVAPVIEVLTIDLPLLIGLLDSAF
jgi:hypothetical protein